MIKSYNYGSHHIDQSDINHIKSALHQKAITNGISVLKLENAVSKIFKCKFTLSCNSGTSAIYMVLSSIGLKKGDNVIIPSINFVAAANICKIMGANIFFADVDKHTYQLSKKNVEDCIKNNNLKKVKVIFSMFLGGKPCHVAELFELKKELKSYLIEDACHALGSKYIVNKKKYYVGQSKHADFSIFSLHPVKTITSGEGGLICTNLKKNFLELKKLRSHGITGKKNFSYDVVVNSLNFRLSDINCALAISQFRKLKKFVRWRQKLAQEYHKKFSNLKDYLRIVNYNNKSLSCWHLLIVEINFKKLKIDYKKFYLLLKKKGINTQLHYIPTYRFKAFTKYLNFKKSCKNSETYYKKCLSFPIYYNLKLSQVRGITLETIKIIKKYEKL